MAKRIHRTIPRLDGFHMPAEWSKHSRTYMLFPYQLSNWKSSAKPAQKAHAAIAKAISTFEPVVVGVPTLYWQDALHLYSGSPGIELKEIESDDCWIRDTGPTFLINNAGTERGGVAWKFNGYGGIYPPLHDTGLASALLESRASAIYSTMSDNFVLEGGSIHVDGEGTVLTTEECLLNPNRNPHMSKGDIERKLLDYLGAEKVIWLPKGVVADTDTSGHIDNICCFTAPGNVLLAWSDDPSDEQYHISREALRVLESAEDAKGRKLRVKKMPMPPPMHYTEEDLESLVSDSTAPTDSAALRVPGQRLAASYINFYIVNDGIVAPAFDTDTDREAERVLQECFPDRKIVMIPCSRDILLGGGNIHCITQQEPYVKGY